MLNIIKFCLLKINKLVKASRFAKAKRLANLKKSKQIVASIIIN